MTHLLLVPLALVLNIYLGSLQWRNSRNHSNPKNPEQSPPRNNEEKLNLLQTAQNDLISTSSCSSTMATSDDRKDVAIKTTGDNGLAKDTDVQQQKVGTVWRGSSYDFSQDATAKEIGDFGFVLDLSSPQRLPLSKIPESPNTYGVLTPGDVRVLFNEVVQWRSNASNGGGGGGASGEVVVCRANASFRRKSTCSQIRSGIGEI